ncbi:MAG: heparan-alpha-glucosaminide N-acetyltransferase domain-containing protein [Chloroflexi bacterium]|nr:heparan-alpha-glucosaminide N-acetyltransferase domain-containing protein [Chloroflexota bacterium]
MTSIGIADASSATIQTKTNARLLWLDGLRGLIMVIMAIDHASYFVAKSHWGEFWGLPLPDYGTAAAFLTRFVTHICAPGFFFLMGISMMLFAHNRYHLGWSTGQVARHFAIRGALLILFQNILENPTWLIGDLINPVTIGDPPGVAVPFSSIWVSCSRWAPLLIIWGLLLRANLIGTLLISFVAIMIPQIFVPTLSSTTTLYSPLLLITTLPAHTNALQVYYPILPWLGMTGIGVAFGKLLWRDAERAYKTALLTGISALILFVALRLMGGFGNIHPPQNDTWISFLSVTKYPPA